MHTCPADTACLHLDENVIIAEHRQRNLDNLKVLGFVVPAHGPSRQFSSHPDYHTTNGRWDVDVQEKATGSSRTIHVPQRLHLLWEVRNGIHFVGVERGGAKPMSSWEVRRSSWKRGDRRGR